MSLAVPGRLPVQKVSFDVNMNEVIRLSLFVVNVYWPRIRKVWLIPRDPVNKRGRYICVEIQRCDEKRLWILSLENNRDRTAASEIMLTW